MVIVADVKLFRYRVLFIADGQGDGQRWRRPGQLGRIQDSSGEEPQIG